MVNIIWDEESKVTGGNEQWNCGMHINQMELLREAH